MLPVTMLVPGVRSKDILAKVPSSILEVRARRKTLD